MFNPNKEAIESFDSTDLQKGEVMDNKRHAARDMVLFLMIDIYTFFFFVCTFYYRYKYETFGEVVGVLLWPLVLYYILSYVITSLILIIPYSGRMYRGNFLFKCGIVSLFLFSRYYYFAFVAFAMFT